MWDNHLQVIKIDSVFESALSVSQLQQLNCSCQQLRYLTRAWLRPPLCWRWPWWEDGRGRRSLALVSGVRTLCLTDSQPSGRALLITEESAQPLAQTLSLSSPSSSTSSSSSPSTLAAVIMGSWALPNHQSQRLSDRCRRRSSSSSRARASAWLSDEHHH